MPFLRFRLATCISQVLTAEYSLAAKTGRLLILPPGSLHPENATPSFWVHDLACERCRGPVGHIHHFDKPFDGPMRPDESAVHLGTPFCSFRGRYAPLGRHHRGRTHNQFMCAVGAGPRRMKGACADEECGMLSTAQ